MKVLLNDFWGGAFPLQLSRELARNGHTVLHAYFAANNTPKGETEPREDDPPSFSVKGVTIGRVFKKHSLFSRRAADIAYGNAVSDHVRAFQPDVVLSANMPLDGQKILLKTTHQANAKFIFWCQDLLSIATEFVLRKKGVPLAGLAGYIYGRMERRLLSESDAVVCIAPEFRTQLEQWNIPSDRTFVIENWAPLDEILPLQRPTAWACEQGIAGKFCFMYSGTLGMKHKPELLLSLARHFQEREDVVVVVIAQGAGADWLRRNANVRPGALLLLPFQPYAKLSEVLGAADVLITLLDADCGAFAVPSKTLAYLCASRPLLMAAPERNLAARIVKRAVAGIVVGDPAPERFVAAAIKLSEDAAARQAYAVSARAYAEHTFSIERIGQQFLQVMDFAISPHKGKGQRPPYPQPAERRRAASAS